VGGAAVRASQFGFRYLAGAIREGTRQLYVSRGIGAITAPIRWGCPRRSVCWYCTPLDKTCPEYHCIGTVTQMVVSVFRQIDPRSPVPLYAQIADRLRIAVATGELAMGAALPSVRQLASQLRVNPATVVQAYRQLEEVGVVESRRARARSCGNWQSRSAKPSASARRVGWCGAC